MTIKSVFILISDRYSGVVKQQIQELIDIMLAEQRNNLFLWAPFCFAVGIAIYFALSFEPAFMLSGVALSACLALLVLLFKWRDHAPLLRLSFLCAIGVSIIAAGFCVAQLRANIVYTPMLVKKMSPVGVVGIIKSIEPLGGKDGSRLILRDVEIERLKPNGTPRKIRLKVRQNAGLRAGQRISVLAGLNPASPPVAPDAFDFQRMSYFKGIGAVGFAYSKPEIIEGNASRSSWLTSIRSNIINKIEKTSQNLQKNRTSR